MTKKNRTGLQSEISHIFAGVPIPRKKHPHHEGPESKPETTEPTQEIQAEQLPPEQPAAEPQAAQPPAEQEQVEAAAVEEPLIVEIPSEEKQEIQPPVMKPLPEQPEVPLTDTIEVPEFEKTVEVKQPAAVVPMKTRAAKERAAAPVKTSARVKERRPVSKTAAGSRKQKILLVFAITLSVLLVFLLVKPFKKSPQNTAGRRPRTPANAGANIKPDTDRIKIEWTKPDIYPSNIRDPMRESSEQQFYSDTGVPVVRGISYGTETKYAVMNTGAIVQEGEEVFGWKVVKINPGAVLFEKDGKTLELEPQGEK